ncbi:MAG TPA: two-component regulator propeller domain-containing protein, partial [Bacteroidia bacterium]
MKTYSLKILATLLVMWHYSVFAQTEIFNSLNVEDGLAQSQVHCILQDNRGYVWFGTDGGGACRYDGKSFVTLNATNGLPSDKILSFAKDKQGNIWIGTERGIAVYNGHKLISLPSDFKRTNDQRIYGIVCGDNDSIWFATSDYVSVWNGRSLQKIDSTEGLIRCVFRDSRGSIWAGTYNKGLYKITGTHVKKYTMANGLSAGSVESIAEPVKGELWLCNNEGIDIFHTDDDKIETIPEMKGKVTKFIFNDNKNVWILTEGPDVYHFSGHNFRQLINKQTMSKEIWSVLKDREGNLWFGSNGAGVIKQQSTPFLILTNKDGLCGELVLSMLHDRKGNEWYGTEKGITQIVKDKATGEKHANYFFKEGRTWALLEDKKGNIWFSTTEHGVYKYDGHVLKNYSDKDLGGHYVRSLLEDDQGNIWIGVNTGLVKFDGKNFKIYKKEDGILSMAIASTKDHKGDLWFATGAGLFKYNNLSDKFIGFTNADGLSNDALMGITEDSDGNIWCGGFKGISKVDFNNRTCKNISISEGLTSNSVYVLASDNLGYIYVGTNQGIDRVNANLYNRTGDLKIKHYGKEEGFIGLECNTNSYLNAKDGSIWFGSINGAARLDPARLQPNNAPPLLYITGINLFFDPFDWTNFSQGTDPESALPVRLALPYNKNHLTFNCIALSLTIPEKTLYSFKMVGFDKTWSPPNKQSYVTYSYLPPGNYTFEVRAMNSDGVWAKKPARFSFTIDPPFWQTWWFYLLSAIFF